MDIVANPSILHKGNPVSVKDVFECGGVDLAVIVTTDGSRPYVGGNVWPVYSDRATVPVAELVVVAELDQPSLNS